MKLNKWFTQIAETVSHAAGHAVAFIICCIVVFVWAASGPAFGFSDTWQLVINTGTTIVTFLMVFLIQNTQNRDGAAIQAKLDELILVTAAENTFIGIEHLTEEEVNEFRKKNARQQRKEQRAPGILPSKRLVPKPGRPRTRRYSL
jgi:low affinity Fe/Cu permease